MCFPSIRQREKRNLLRKAVIQIADGGSGELARGLRLQLYQRWLPFSEASQVFKGEAEVDWRIRLIILVCLKKISHRSTSKIKVSLVAFNFFFCKI